MDKLRIIQWTTGKVGKLDLLQFGTGPGCRIDAGLAHAPAGMWAD